MYRFEDFLDPIIAPQHDLDVLSERKTEFEKTLKFDFSRIFFNISVCNSELDFVKCWEVQHFSSNLGTLRLIRDV